MPWVGPHRTRTRSTSCAACGLTGAKEGCAEGECGACSVLVARPAVGADGEDAGTEWTAINACLVPAAALDGQEVVTAEGLGAPDALHPVQQEMAVRGGSQCGYCTPGFVCSMAAEFYREAAAPAIRPRRLRSTGNGHAVPRRSDEHADGDHEHGPNGFDLHALSGNLCRCTGYRPIRDAAYALGDPADDDPLAARRAEPAPPPAHDQAAGRARRLRPPGRPGRGAATCSPSTRTPSSSPAPPTGASRSTSAAPGRRSSSPSTGCRSCASSTVGDDDVEIGAALTLTRGRAPARPAGCRCWTSCSRSSPPG